MLLKTSFLLLHLFCNVILEFSFFHNTEHSSDILLLKIEILLAFQNMANIDFLRFKLMQFGFALISSDIDF